MVLRNVIEAAAGWEAETEARAQELRAVHAARRKHNNEGSEGSENGVVDERKFNKHVQNIIKHMFGYDMFSSCAKEACTRFGDDKSIFGRLQRYAHEEDEKLDPCDMINSTLSELVEYIQTGNIRQAVSACEFCEVQKQICAMIDSNELLKTRAAMIRDVAARAEGRLERFYAQKLLECDTGEVDAQQRRVRRVCEAAAQFPYMHNYEHMVQREFEVLRESVGDAERDGSMSEVRVAFCGSGPLPLSGLLLSALGDMKVTLIDCDEEAVALSRRLVHKWERLGILAPRLVSVLCMDAQHVRFTRGAARRRHEVQCDVVFVAALLSAGARQRLLWNAQRQSAAGGCAPPLLALRTAHGLTARVAYERVRANSRARVALVVPRQHVDHGGHVLDELDGTVATHLFDGHILNSLELHWP